MSTIFINEIHYDNDGADTGEAIEIAAPAGTNLAGWTLVLYNGAGGSSYATINLSGIVADTGGGYGTLGFAATGLQNGSPDGIALVNNSGTVIQFLSYEGSFTAVGGAAGGMVSTDVGVSESGSNAAGGSLQLTGTGTDSADFSWTVSTDDSFGSINTGQTFGGGGGPTPGSLSIADASIAEGDSGTTNLVFTVTRSGGSTGAVSATYSTTLGTASAGDLSGTLSGTVNFAAGETSRTITIAIAGDTAIESNETFTVTLAGPTGGATLGDASATGTIINDDSSGVTGPVFINEFHYDNNGTDVGEAVELAGLAGTDLSGWSLVYYNGNGGVSYATTALSGIIGDQDGGYGTLSFAGPGAGIQNGSPDAIALVDGNGDVVQFLSYEGTLLATDGAAAGLTSTDIGVSEDGSGGAGFSMQLVGNGSDYADFTWVAAQVDNFGAVNTDQSFSPPSPNGNIRIGDASVSEGDSGTTAMTFTVSRGAGTTGAVSVDYAVVLGAASPSNASASDISGTLSGTINFAAGEATRTITVLVNGDTAGEANEAFTVQLTNATGGAVLSDGVATGTIVNDDFTAIAIYTIQGAGHASAFAGQALTTTGIVTAVDTNGFYMQDPTGDGNSATSDAIFVFTNSPPSVTVGDAVVVAGTVQETLPGNSTSNLTVTQLIPTSVGVTSSGNALPGAVVIGPSGIAPPSAITDDDGLTSYDPLTDGMDFYESLEGMLVTVENPHVLQNTNSFGEIWTVASDGAGNLTSDSVSADGHVVISGSLGALGTSNTATSDFNPERIQIQADAGLGSGSAPTVEFGDVLADVTGVISYSFGSYELLAVDPITVVSTPTIVDEVTTLTGSANQLTIASFNVENLDPGDGAQRFSDLGVAVGSLSGADIIMLSEIQDNDGATNSSTVSASVTLQMLCDAIFAETGVQYSWVDNPFVTDDQTGGEPGGNIRNAILFREDRVDLVVGSVRTVTDPTDQATNPDNPYYNSRIPIVADFTFGTETITVIGNHFTSKGGSDPLLGAQQPPDNAGEARRAAQADGVNDFIDAMLALNANANIITAGDFNDFQFEEPLAVLTGELDFDGTSVTAGSGAVLTNLTYLLDEDERYSYVFEGNGQQLDHILVSNNLYANAEFDLVHINNIGGLAVSDHDPAIARITFGGSLTITGTPNVDVLVGTAANETINALGSNDTVRAGGGNDIVNGDAGDDFLRGQTGNDTINGGAGNDYIDGGAGADAMTGGIGDDIFIVDVAGDTVSEGGGGGIDEVRSAIDFTLGANIENLRLQAAGVIGIGNALDNSIFGGATANTLSGLDGNDSLYGNSNNDVLNGDAGDDFALGGQGNDTLNGGDGADRLRGEDNSDTLNGGAGIDLLFGGLGNDVLNGGADNDTLRGEDQNDTLNGDDGTDNLFGGIGADTMNGGAGSDRLTGGTERDVMFGGTGKDYFQFDDGDFSGVTLATADWIRDFSKAETDIIRLDLVDAVAGGADNAFAFIGTGAFSNVAGQLRYQYSGTSTLVYGDTNGDGTADFAIRLDGNIALVAADFQL